jgi:hypothetical protein
VEGMLARPTTVDEITLEPLIGPAKVIELRSLIVTAESGEDTILAESPLIELEHVQEWEKGPPAIRAGGIRIVYTGRPVMVCHGTTLL